MFKSEKERLKNRRALLDTMQKRLLAGPKRTEMAGGMVVPYSMGEGFSRIAQALLQRGRESDYEEESKQLATQEEEARSEAMERIKEAIQGRDQIGYDYPPERENAPMVPDYEKAATIAQTDPALEDDDKIKRFTQDLLKERTGGKETSSWFEKYPVTTTDEEGNPKTTWHWFDKRTKESGELGEGQEDPRYSSEVEKSKKYAGEKGKLGAQLEDKPKLEADIITSKAEAEDVAKGDIRRKDMPLLVQKAKDILKAGVATESGIGTLYDTAAGFFGSAPEGSKEAAELRSIGGMLTSKAPRMEGPQSDYDVQLYKEMAGKIGDSTVPIEIRLQALQTVEDMWMKPPNQAYKDYIEKRKTRDFSNMSDDDFLNSEPK